jgi:putative ABC transport system permease protein
MATHDDRLTEEIEFHIEQQTAKNIRAGMRPDDAARAARAKFGNVSATKDYARDEIKFAVIRDFARDLRLGGRRLRRSPGFASAAILTFGLGIGAATAMFSVVNGVLLQPLPYPQPDRIVRLQQIGKNGPMNSVSHPNFVDWRAETHSFAVMSEVAAYGRETVFASSPEPTLAEVARVENAFLDVMRVRPASGRAFVDEELKVGGRNAALVSARFWQRIAAGKPFQSGQALSLEDQVFPIVGVMPEGFEYPGNTEIWIPLEVQDRSNQSRTAHNFQAIARLADGVTLDAARSDLSRVSRSLKARYPNDNAMLDGTAQPLLDLMTKKSRPSLLMLFAASVLLLVVACTNVSNLLLVRAAARRGELAVQLAIGASRMRLVRQNLAETLVLCVSGGLLGVLISLFVVRFVAASGISTAPRLNSVHVNWAVLSFAIAASVLSALVLSVITAFSDRNGSLTSILSTAQRGNSGGRRDLAGRELLIVIQTALTVVLLSGAALLGASFMRVLAVDPGFRIDDAVVLDLTWPFPEDDAMAAKQASVQDAILSDVGRLPGVTAAGMINGFPLGGDGSFADGGFVEMTRADELSRYDDIRARGPEWYKANSANAQFRIVSDGYFRVMGIPVIAGRDFRDSDVAGGRQVAVISKSLADLRWKNRNPIGAFIQFGNMDGDFHGLEVVGIVGDVHELSLEDKVQPTVYALNRQRPRKISSGSLVLRGGEPAATIAAAREVIHRADPRVPVEARTVVTAFEKIVGNRRFTVDIVAAFGLVALLLSAIGVYGLISYSVEQRTRELGIRIALGATPGGITRLIVGRGAALALAGCAAGLAIALALGQIVSGLLFGTKPNDPLVLAAVGVLMLAVTALATYLPVRRALAKSPVTSLRSS